MTAQYTSQIANIRHVYTIKTNYRFFKIMIIIIIINHKVLYTYYIFATR